MRILAILTLLGGMWFIVTLVLLIVNRSRKSRPIAWIQRYIHFFSLQAYVGAFVVSLLSMSGSLYFSEIAHYTPCLLCWYQRILMYPQVLLFFVSLVKRTRHITDHILALSSVGAVIALFHYYEQMTNTQIVTCGTVGVSTSCTEKFVTTFGYITIPMMALTAFVMIILLMVMSKYRQKNITKIPYVIPASAPISHVASS